MCVVRFRAPQRNDATTQRRRKCASLDRVEPLDNGSYEVKTLHFSPEKLKYQVLVFGNFDPKYFPHPYDGLRWRSVADENFILRLYYRVEIVSQTSPATPSGQCSYGWGK